MNYGYNKYSSNMSPRGRGFNSRGGSSYRGRGGGGGGGGGRDWNNSNSSGRGNYTSRGGFNKYNSNSNYDSRNKYNSGGSERYSNRGGRGEHSNAYKRPRDSYSGRDDHRSSSDSGRKRMRNDSYQGGGSSSSQRYSGSYGGSSTSGQYDDKRSSNSTYEDKRQNERTSSYHRSDDSRHSASRNYTTPQPPRISDMAPPAPRYTSSRGRISRQTSSYRGRSSTRGRGGGGIHRGSRSDIILSRKRTLGTLDYRRKLLGSRSRDYIQRVRMTTTKMRRSSGTTRLSGSKKDSAPSMKDKDRMAKAINAEFSDEDDDDNRSNWDEDEKPHGEDDENAEEDEDKTKKEEKIKPKQERTTEDEEEKDDVVKDDEEDPKPDEDDEEEVEGKEEDAKEENARSGSDELPSRRDGRRFIKLNCAHCQHRSVTFKEYTLHLYSGKHNSAMRRVAAKHKAMLARMRIIQRQDQRRLEARDEARGTLPSRTIFCPVCKLNYRSLKAVHNLSDSHRQIKRFLTPFCRVCRIQFKSPMTYETHVCSLDHIRKNLQDEKKSREGDEVNSSGGEDEDKEMNLDNFMTLDSVGDVDAEEDEESGDKKKKEKSEGDGTDSEKKAKTKQMIKVGSEYIKRVEVQFCELCKVYLPRSENNERAVALHCSTRSHLKRYVRDNDDKALRRQAERIHLQSSSSTTTTNSLNTSENAKGSVNADQPNSDSVASGNEESTKANSDNGTMHEESKDDEEEEEDVDNEKATKNNKETENEEEDEDEYGVDSGDKLFDDVDKDLGNILREAETGARSSDDEDSRYDRFRNTGKKQQQQQQQQQSQQTAKEKNGDEKQPTEEKETIVKKSETKPKTVA
ncbi:DBIRD complex subunit ZNF326 isoform X3 [Leptopilina heterotoma]|uniref:DBIRD complex subunit ZNF326 isoform X3 n=1 Tax=Leptopilina heterotoma TaxID=63436 RepID=UPI001CA83A31|nr:DBIRD complex subunit ZNF326 isoform X3 [Leptopilina heterotoma]